MTKLMDFCGHLPVCWAVHGPHVFVCAHVLCVRVCASVSVCVCTMRVCENTCVQVLVCGHAGASVGSCTVCSGQASAVAMSRLSRPQNPDITAGPLSRQSSGGHPRLLPQTSTADNSSLPPSVVQVLSGAPRVGAGRRWARGVGESIEGGKRNKRVGGE